MRILVCHVLRYGTFNIPVVTPRHGVASIDVIEHRDHLSSRFPFIIFRPFLAILAILAILVISPAKQQSARFLADLQRPAQTFHIVCVILTMLCHFSFTDTEKFISVFYK